jgi:uncharacterized lipoprotein NlpE involved in copper resistance
MKVIRYIFYILLIFLYGCSQNNQKIIDMHNSRISLDWQGTYQGTVPSADCPGIKTTITLKKGSYLISKNYSGEAKTFIQKGSLKWDKNGNIIVLSNINNGPDKYRVQENRLLQLDIGGKEISGALSKNYILKKI